MKSSTPDRYAQVQASTFEKTMLGQKGVWKDHAGLKQPMKNIWLDLVVQLDFGLTEIFDAGL